MYKIIDVIKYMVFKNIHYKKKNNKVIVSMIKVQRTYQRAFFCRQYNLCELSYILYKYMHLI